MGSSDCSFIGLTCTIRDLVTGDRFAFKSGHETDSPYARISGSQSGSVFGHEYENEAEAYGYDPAGIPFVYYARCTAYAA